MGTLIAKKRWLIPVIMGLLAVGALAGSAFATGGNISPLAIEIDGNLYPGSGDCDTFPSGTDWIKDCLDNTDTATLIDSIATGVNTTVGSEQTGAVATGHWNGVRIVDGIGNQDQDIFVKGGKEDDVTTWDVQAGSVGSGKYDITQAYMANNQTTLFIGMEKRTNNGTTAFDFEFNQYAPVTNTTYRPNRTIGDALLTFEISGGRNPVSHKFVWDGTAYVETDSSNIYAMINTAAIPAAPWGFVSDQGHWVTGTLQAYQFAEARIPLTDLPGVDACGGYAWVQVRTRSSATSTSDLKDTTRIFKYVFGGPTATPELSTNCSGQLIFDGSKSRDSSGGTNLTYGWTITVPTGITLTGSGITGPDLSGAYHSTSISGTASVGFPGAVG